MTLQRFCGYKWHIFYTKRQKYRILVWELLSAESDIVRFHELNIIVNRYVINTSWNCQSNWKPIYVLNDDLKRFGVKIKSHKTPNHCTFYGSNIVS